jgi:hypothetical protein
MAVVALTSARGAPGVSTAALAMTLLWPRPALLAECDPAGGSSALAGYLRGTVDHSRGLLNLAVAHRHGELEQTLWSQLVPLTATATATATSTADASAGTVGWFTATPDERWLLPGLSDAAQAPSTAALWGPLSSLLASLERAGTDVIIDAGRLGATHAPTPLLRHADLMLLVTGTSLPAVAAARARLSVLRDELAVTATGGADTSALGLLLVGEGRPYTAREITGALGVPTVAALAWDPASAEVLSAGAAPGRRFDTSPLVRSARAAISAVGELVTSRRDRLAPRTTHVGTDGTPAQSLTSLLLREVGS